MIDWAVAFFSPSDSIDSEKKTADDDRLGDYWSLKILAKDTQSQGGDVSQ